jgi:hypothetical protein
LFGIKWVTAPFLERGDFSENSPSQQRTKGFSKKKQRTKGTAVITSDGLMGRKGGY